MTTRPKGKKLGYVLANVGAVREAHTSHTTIMKDRDEALAEAREWAKRGERYTVCSVWVEEE
jgi:hypothetical protein